jgi:hypothetical protein
MRESENESVSLQPLGVSIRQCSELTSESEWQVKEHLRNGEYKAKKSGRRTIIIYASVVHHWRNLPEATFKPLKRKHPHHVAALT